MKKTDPLIVVEEVYNCSPEKVWNALTNPDEMRRWYFDNIPDFKAITGFETRFDIKNEGRLFRHQWRVKKVERQRKLIYNWTYEHYQGSSDAVFELTPQDNGKTRLRLSVEVLEDFPDDVPEFDRQSCIAGWEYFLNERLKNYLGNE